MKRIGLFLVALFIVSTLFAADVVTLTVNGQGTTKEIATANANGGLDNVTAQLVEFSVTKVWTHSITPSLRPSKCTKRTAITSI